MEVRADGNIRNRLHGSLGLITPPTPSVDRVIRRGRSLRRRQVVVGVVIAMAAVAGVGVPLALLSPLRANRSRTQILPGSASGRLVVAARRKIAPGMSDVVSGYGSVWVIGPRGVYRVEPATNLNRVIAFIPLRGTGDASRIAVGERSVWVTAPELRPDGSRGTLVRIDPATNRLVATIHLGGYIRNVAAGGGSVWVAILPGSVVRVDPKINRVIGRVEVGSGPSAIVYGAGFVWVTSTNLGGLVSKIDPTTGRVVTTLAVSDVQAIGGGSLWGVGPDSVLRIDPVSGSVLASIHVARAEDVAVDGNTVWVLVSPKSSNPSLFYPIKGTAGVERIDLVTNRVVGPPLAIDDLQPIALTAGTQAAWVADFDSGTLTRIEVVA